MPVIDSVKIIVNGVINGINQGREEVEQAKENADKELFSRANSEGAAVGVTVAYDRNLYRKDNK